MKMYYRNLLTTLSLGLLVFTTGCSTTQVTDPVQSANDFIRIEQAVSTPSIKGGVELTASMVTFREADPVTGEPTGPWIARPYVTEGSTLSGRVVEGLAATVPAALINARAWRRQTDMANCGQRGCGPSIINMNEGAVAGAISESVANSTLEAVLSGRCSTGNCAALAE